jgi:hypothetical protein
LAQQPCHSLAISSHYKFDFGKEQLALGAQARDVLKLVIGQGIKLALAGLILGLAGALALTRLLKTQLYGVSTTDPLTFVGITLCCLSWRCWPVGFWRGGRRRWIHWSRYDGNSSTLPVVLLPSSCR